MKMKVSYHKQKGGYEITVHVSSPPAMLKWASGTHDANWFAANGTPFEGDSFTVASPGLYTIYADDLSGNATVKRIRLSRFRIPFLSFVFPSMHPVAASVGMMAVAGMITAGVIAGSLYMTQPPTGDAHSSQPSRADSSIAGAIDGAESHPTQSEVLATLQQKEVTVTDNISSAAIFSSGRKGTSGNFEIENTAKNTVAMQAEIIADGKAVAKSAVIKPGQHAESISLLTDLPTGSTSATAHINYYDTGTGNYLSAAEYTITLSVA